MAGKPFNTHPRGYSEYYVAWRGDTPLLYPPSPLISHPIPKLKSMQKMVNWRLVEHGLEVTKHLRQPHLGTRGDMGWGCPLLGLYSRVRSRSHQGHFKVKPAIILNKNIFFQFPYVFCCKGVFPKVAVDICGWEAFQHASQGVQGLYVALRGITPLLYHPSPLISHPVPALT